MDTQKIAERIKYARSLKKYTLDDIATEIGVAKSTIQRYENGLITRPKLPVLQSIAFSLEVNPAWLSGKDVDMKLPANATGNMIICPDCGESYDYTDEGDVAEHRREHSMWEKAMKKFGTLYCNSIENERIKAENRKIRNDKSRPLSDRYNAELEVLRCLFSRSVQASGFDLNHKSFNEYVAMMMNNKTYCNNLDDELCQKLIDDYGTSSGIKDGESIYYIPASEQHTIAAHFDGDEYTKEEIDKIKEFAAFVKANRK